MKINQVNKPLASMSFRSQEFKDLIQRIKEKPDHEPQPEADFLHRYEWEGMITIRFESNSWNSYNDSAHFRRRHLIRALMNNLRGKWGHNRKDMYWVASTEYGDSGAAHCHIIFSFFPLTSKGKNAPDLTDFVDFLEESLSHICEVQKVPAGSVDFHWSPKYDDFGLVNYVCKKEPGREFKHFEWSTEGRKWKQHAVGYCTKAAVSVLKKEVATL